MEDFIKVYVEQALDAEYFKKFTISNTTTSDNTCKCLCVCVCVCVCVRVCVCVCVEKFSVFKQLLSIKHYTALTK